MMSLARKGSVAPPPGLLPNVVQLLGQLHALTSYVIMNTRAATASDE
jgi:hypothetical protein